MKDDLEAQFAHLAGEQWSTDYVSAIALGMYFLENSPVLARSVENVAM